jgi:hypothetical protein
VGSSQHLSARAYTNVASTCHTESEGGYKVVDLPVLAEVGIRGTQDYAIIQLFCNYTAHLDLSIIKIEPLYFIHFELSIYRLSIIWRSINIESWEQTIELSVSTLEKSIYVVPTIV